MPKKSNKEECVNKANIKHNYKYTYDNLIYTKSNQKSWITCPIHGDFEQRINDHLSGCGCPICKNEKISFCQKSNKEYFVSKSKQKHKNNKYEYEKTVYVDDTTEVEIFCNDCQEYFWQTPSHHLQGQGCKKCGYKTIIEKLSSTKEEFLKKLFIKFPENKIKYNYDFVVYVNSNEKIKIFCKCCNNNFEQTPANHLSGHGCNKCTSSKSEELIRKILISNNLEFVEQKRFKECKNINCLPFDFYLPKYNILIEYDGKQHFEVIHRSKDPLKNEKEFQRIQKNDSIKTQWAKENNILLYRITYKQDVIVELDKILNSL